MIIDAFLKWSETAPARDRAKAAGALAAAFVGGAVAASERNAAQTALTYLLDDPSPKVRLAIACAMAHSVAAPRPIVHALTRDQLEVASRIVAFSPVLSDGDLVDIVADCLPEIQRVVAMRETVSMAVSAAIAEIGEWQAVCDLLENPGARVAAVSARRIVERFGDVAEIRSALLARPDLPGDVRHGLVVRIGDALAAAPFVRSALGEARVERITRDACQQATLHLCDEAEGTELGALVEHLRIQGQLTPALLAHALCRGSIDFFAAALVSLTGRSERRVRSIVADGRMAVMSALYRSAGLSPAIADVFVTATHLWRNATRRGIAASASSIAEKLMERHAHDADANRDIADLLMLIEKLNLAHRRAVAREDAAAMAVRAA